MDDATHHGRILGLDVLRSVAVLLVIVSHFTNNFSYWYGLKPPHRVFFSGDLGVDLFFALSGFLIGRILLDIARRDPSRRNLIVFLVRRWLRTLPLYFVWLLVLAVFFPPTAHLWRTLASFGSLTQNLWQAMPSDYWFAVSWSLTIEEWFYLLFGIGTIACAMVIRRSWAIWLPLAALLVVPLCLRLTTPIASYFDAGYDKMVPFRLDEIGYGVILAWLYTRRSRLFDYPLPALCVGLGLITAAWFDLLPLPFALYVMLRNTMAVIGCALCIPAALRIHAAPPAVAFCFRRISHLSYALYLVHLTILVDVAQSLWFQKRISAEFAVVLAVIGPLAVAELLSRYVEQPLMRRRPRQFRAAAPPHYPAVAAFPTASHPPPSAL